MQSSSAQSEQSKAGNAALPIRKGDGSLIERKVWTILLALPLLAYCVVTVLTYTIKPTPINTGDPLYDKYLVWVLDDFEQLFRQDNNSHQFQNPPHRRQGKDPFADWEDEFGNDPRYWMLRYRYSLTATASAGGIRTPDTRHLRRAKNRGVADGAVLFTLLVNNDKENWDRTLNMMPSRQSKMRSYADWTKDQRRQVDILNGVEQTKLLAELLEIAGDHSAPHYFAALMDYQRGKYQLAINHLRDGNQAPHNNNLVGFPFDVHLSNLNSGQPLTDKIINGSIFIDGMSLPFPDFNQYGGMVSLLVADAISRNDWAALDEIHTFGCRFGMTKGIALDNSMLSVFTIGKVAIEVRDSVGSSLSKDQLNALHEIIYLKTQARKTMATAGAWTQMLAPYGPSPIQQAIGTMEVWLSGGKRGIQAHVEAVSHDFSQEQEVLNGPIRQFFEQMETFNYNTLEFE